MADVVGNIADAVYQHRTRLGLTQDELAKRAGVSRHTVSNVENGTAEGVRLKTVSSIFNAMGLEVIVTQKIAAMPPAPTSASEERDRFRRRFVTGGAADYALLTPRK